MAASMKTLFIAVLVAAILLAGVVSIGISMQFSILGKGSNSNASLQGLKSDTDTMGAEGMAGPAGQRGPCGPQGPKGLSTPEYDSGWINIADKTGQLITVTHNLSAQDIITQITGKMAVNDGSHQRGYGLAGYIPGWSKTYGGAGVERANSGIQTKDNGYALVGYANASFYLGSGAGVNNDVWLVKTNSEGIMQWSKTYGGPNDERGYNLIQTKDGGYTVIGGNKFGNARIDNNEVLLIKTDSFGNQQWNKTYGKPNTYMWGTSVIETTDGGYAIAAAASLDRSTGYDFGYVIKTDTNGNVQWDSIYNGTVHAQTWHIAETADGGYAIGGYDNAAGGNDTYYRLIKVDNVGNVQWSKNYGDGIKLNLCRGFTKTRDGGFALAGFSGIVGDQFDIWLIKTDQNGNIQWNKTYGGPKDDKTIWFGLVETPNGYAIGGYTQSYGAGTNGSSISGTQNDYPPGTDAWLIKTDSYGNLQLNRTFGEPNDDEYASAIIKTNDGGLALVGSKRFANDENWDMLLIKVGFEGESGLAWIDSTANSLTLYRGANDIYWNYVRVQIWKTR